MSAHDGIHFHDILQILLDYHERCSGHVYSCTLEILSKLFLCFSILSGQALFLCLMRQYEMIEVMLSFAAK